MYVPLKSMSHPSGRDRMQAPTAVVRVRGDVLVGSVDLDDFSSTRLGYYIN